MVGARLVRSLGRPGGDITGISILGTELDGKRRARAVSRSRSSQSGRLNR
jgi:hypothetical protein